MLQGMDVVARLFLGAVLGGFIGLEREIRARSAGLRTHALVGLGSTLFMIVSQQMLFMYGEGNVDPSRIAAQIITGIGFIGAGTIMKSKFTMKGLTTAASIWTVASIGMAVGAGLYRIGIITAFGAVLILTLLEMIEPVLDRNWYKTLLVVSVASDELVDKVKSVIKEKNGEIKNFSIENDKSNNTLEIFTTVKFRKKYTGEDITKKIAAIGGVRKVKCE